ncbi:MAG: hypothetical protein NXI31_12985 [bacterium]|nr:hypothetical protein [bacterium]
MRFSPIFASSSPLRFVAQVLVASALTGAALAQGCLDQSYLPNPQTNGLEITAAQPVTQTFTVGRSGRFDGVELSAINHHRGVTTNSLQVDLVTTDASGVPTTNVLASATLAPGSVPTSRGAVYVDLSAANVQVTSGQVLGIALTSPNQSGQASYAWWGEAPGGGYAGGQVFIRQNVGLAVWDLSFRTWVSTPATWINYGTGLAGSIAVPALTSVRDPVIGTTPLIIVGTSAPASFWGVLALGFQRDNTPTPFGGQALVVPVSTLVLFVPPSAVSVPLAIPNDPSLCGLKIMGQSGIFDPGAPAGVALSRGLEYTIGV